jgi:hypothetical protein
VSLSASGLPSGSTASFSPNPVGTSQTTSTLTIATSSSTPTGSYSITVIGNGGGLTRFAVISLTVTQPTAFNFTISGNPAGSLYPGGVTRYINLSLTNPNSVTISVTSLTTSLQAVSAPNADAGHPCATGDFSAGQFSGGYPFALPPGTHTLSQLGFSQTQWPSVQMIDTHLNQDGCEGATVSLSYSGSAHA